jgi:uncharacterized protein
MDDKRVTELIARLALVPHPEGGYYAETYRASLRVVPQLAERSTRTASTAIYYLVTSAQPNTFLHRLRSDEIFHLYEGGPLRILRLHPDGSWDIARLGLDLSSGEQPQVVIPAGTWFGTALMPGSSHCLVGCTVAPGFEFEDFELDGGDLAQRYPDVATIICAMSRTGPSHT